MSNHYYICEWCGSPVTAGEIAYHELHCVPPHKVNKGGNQ